MKAILALADGRIFEGKSFGASGEVTGEVVFNTAMSGYQEVLTDPSYKGQMVTMTYTQIGNTGINPEDIESRGLFLSGFIVKEYQDCYSNWRATMSLDAYLKENGVVGIQGLDTRALTRHLRDKGAQNGIISTVDGNHESLVSKARAIPSMTGLDLASGVSCDKPYHWTEGVWDLENGYPDIDPGTLKYKVVAYDFGIKFNILRCLVDSGCDVTVVPSDYPAEKVLDMNPDGVFLSNGPGDPEPLVAVQQEIRKLVGKKPIFGICLGHQLLGLALGGKTIKLPFGNHGSNLPVMDMSTRKVEITSQNHGFAVDLDTLGDAACLGHENLNDQTVEGIRHCDLPIFSVQHHPEASPGPHDSQYLFGRFVEMMEKHKH
ncbi:MAG: carbamoyl phosphate synthase small subunit [Geobacteraceae bacterium GWC2_55_20]|nr:MAG: carbamoyl phosphate synthase small subunit [Geobacteraceae bacterium GWC2_55_20]OGU20313.1 MAG: carbamoyl phosphate synthase small subunit [Geobacteraceae bacterium GWF2_54_21]HBA73331.1 carbamoyl phosphate synthase small subunit [Geobacter sp.]HCE67510.1 carbamoyl phosphate synthase small subunit [Geobacter sp.]